MAILAQLQRFLLPRATERHAQHIYIALVEQARNPYFFEKLHVPDTLDGRFDMIVLHLTLVLSAMKARFAAHPEWEVISRQLIEYFIADMDRSLREMGAGDTGIGKRIQKMTAAFYGRLNGYEGVTTSADLKPILRRNVYGTARDVADADLAVLSDYVLATRETLATSPILTTDGQVALTFASI